MQTVFTEKNLTVEPKKSPISLWDRVRSVGQALRNVVSTDIKDFKVVQVIGGAARATLDNLRHKSAADWAWTASTIGVGAAAKFGLLAGAAALVGAGAIPVIFTAAAGGAAGGLVRGGMNLLRQQHPAHP
ncbi:MAG: hypothetical protein AAB276_07925, partial [Pseudomonadota bacterium]